MNLRFCFYVLLSLSTVACTRQIKNENTLFSLLPSSRTNVTFANTIEETDSVNILSYEYLYNGGGVGILDVNNDGLSDIFFTGNQVANALYLNRGSFQFEDISTSAGIKMENDWSTGVSIVDVNDDGYDDIYVCVGGMGNKSIFPDKLFINQGDLTFKEMAAEYGLADPNESIQSVFFDYDKDGDLDMYLLVGGGFERSAITVRPIFEHGENRNTDKLYKNTYDSTLGHAVFKDVSAEAGILLEGFGLGVSIIDANMDAWPDIFVSNDYLFRDVLYINNGNGTFTDKGLEYLKHTSHFSMGNDVGDINNDGLPDIITVDMLPQDHVRRKQMFGPSDHDRFYQAVRLNYGYQYMRNMLQLNNGSGFTEIGQLAGIYQTDWSWAPLLSDFDNDGYQDLYITNGYGKDITDLDYVKFRNDAVSTFDDRSKADKLFYDSLENRPAVSLPDYIYRNEKSLTFSDQSKHWGITQSSISTGAAYADLDNDGDIDLVVNNIDKEAFIYQNKSVDKDSVSANFLRVRLAGPPSNRKGLGAVVSIYTNGKIQSRSHQLIHGFQSSMENAIHFGLSETLKVDSLIVSWPDGKESRLRNVAVNKTIGVNYEKASLAIHLVKQNQKQLFTKASGVNHKHQEGDVNDFRVQPLLLSNFSTQGPCVAVADINGDGLDDAFIGGAYGANGSLYIQAPKHKFITREFSDKAFEDLGAVFFDADSDGDVDLYVASGGSERNDGNKAYQDRLYINDGKGNFQHDVSALPPMTSSTSSVAAGDVDLDGDLDLFVGGRVTPGKYPSAPESYILENQEGKFVDATDKINASLKNIGMVTAAVWTDFNNDSRSDLVLAGESMRITLLKNNAGKLVDITDQTALNDSYGMWNSLLPADLDNDGDMDLVAGNLGLNNAFKVSPSEPLEIHYADFDKSGSVKPIVSSYEASVAYPVASLDQLTSQLSFLKKHLLHYRDYARTTTAALLNLMGDVSYKTLPCKMLSSTIIVNNGNDEFTISPLPIEAQIAPVNGIIAEDVNIDGLLDLVLVGNFYGPDVVHGRYDGSQGATFINAGGNKFEPLSSRETGFCIDGDARALARIEYANGSSVLLATQNNDSTRSFRIENYNGLRRIAVKDREMSALLTMTNGAKRKVEFSVGCGYLSQSSKSIVVTPTIEWVELFDGNGNKTRGIATIKK